MLVPSKIKQRNSCIESASSFSSIQIHISNIFEKNLTEIKINALTSWYPLLNSNIYRSYNSLS